jgi:hypothetical protein
MVITFVAAVVPAKEIPPFAFSVPVVMVIEPMQLAVVFVPAKLIAPLTVAVPPLMYQAPVRELVVGWLIVTAPFTVSALVPACVSDVFVLVGVIVSELQLLLLFIVTTDALLMTSAPNAVLDVPPMA